MKAGRRVRIALFVGPSLPHAEARQECERLEATVSILPPVQQGDLLGMGNELPDVIAVVDGFFFQVPSVVHKEILLALESGVRVLGAASLGALRAAELDVFGMEGVGEAYRLYKRGVIEGDDEVALLHSDAADGFRPLSEPLINIRHNLKRALVRHHISGRTAAALLAAARELPFMRRSYESVLAAGRRSGVDQKELSALRAFFRDQAVDLKRADTLALLRVLALRCEGRQDWPAHPGFTLNHTVYLHILSRQYCGHLAAGRQVPDTQVLSLHKLLSKSFPAIYRRVNLRVLACDEARHRGLTAGSDERLVRTFRHQRGLGSAAALEQWLAARLMSHQELVVMLVDLQLEARLLAIYRRQARNRPGPRGFAGWVVKTVMERTGLDELALTLPPTMMPGIPWDAPLIRELKYRGGFRSALNVAARMLRRSDEVARGLPGYREALSSERLSRWAASRWGVDEGQLEAAILRRGFLTFEEFLGVTRLAYVSAA